MRLKNEEPNENKNELFNYNEETLNSLKSKSSILAIKSAISKLS